MFDVSTSLTKDIGKCINHFRKEQGDKELSKEDITEIVQYIIKHYDITLKSKEDYRNTEEIVKNNLKLTKKDGSWLTVLFDKYNVIKKENPIKNKQEKENGLVNCFNAYERIPNLNLNNLGLGKIANSLKLKYTEQQDESSTHSEKNTPILQFDINQLYGESRMTFDNTPQELQFDIEGMTSPKDIPSKLWDKIKDKQRLIYKIKSAGNPSYISIHTECSKYMNIDVLLFDGLGKRKDGSYIIYNDTDYYELTRNDVTIESKSDLLKCALSIYDNLHKSNK